MAARVALSPSVFALEPNPARDVFVAETRRVGDGVRAALDGGPVVAFAPFAGSRVAAFRELDVDGMVMVDMSHPGTVDEVRKAIGDPNITRRARHAGGGDNSTDVLEAPVLAEILVKLREELGVRDFDTTVLTLPGKPPRPNTASRISELTDAPYVMRIDFTWNGRPRSVAFVPYQMTADINATRPSLPNELLRTLRPSGYGWLYVSADGVAMFSADQKNGLVRTSKELVNRLQPGGGVIVDDPHASAYVSGHEVVNGIDFFHGRANLATYGLKELAALRPPADIYGYAGLDPEDRVRLYQKPGKSLLATKTDIMSTVGLLKGETHHYSLA